MFWCLESVISEVVKLWSCLKALGNIQNSNYIPELEMFFHLFPPNCLMTMFYLVKYVNDSD